MKEYNRRLLIITSGVAILVTLATALVFSKVGDYPANEELGRTSRNAAVTPPPRPVSAPTPVPLPPLPANAYPDDDVEEGIAKFGEPMLDTAPTFGNSAPAPAISGAPNGNFYPGPTPENEEYGDEDRADENQNSYGL